MVLLVFVIAALAVPRARPDAAGHGQKPAEPPEFDIILRHGTILDGTGGSPYRGDVGVIRDRIARVGDLARSRAALELDVKGLYLAPGFINLHSHAVPAALATAENMLTQGVTTELLNPDGGGRTNITGQLEQAAPQGLAVNVGAYIGFNAAWTTVVGEADRRPTEPEIARMRDILTANLDAGAWGVSAGLDYKPAYFATTEEVVEVVKAAAPWRTNFTNHDRVRPETGYSSRAAMAETIGIASRAGLLPVITHMKVQGQEQGTSPAALAMMDEATKRGSYTAADAYPYLAGQTGLGALLIPAWAQDGGRAQMLERFKNPAERARIVAEVEEAMTARFGGPAGVYLPASRRELVDVMHEMNVRAGEAVVRLLESGNQGVILRFGSEPDLVRILQHPTTSIACDCGAVLPEGAARPAQGSAGPAGASHPRYYGSYPRVLGRYVRERKALTWQDAIRKMTLLPAATIGLIDRGAIASGMMADLVVFDPVSVIDRATFEEPTIPSEGIRHVIVNGVVALRDGRPTGDRGGRVLRRAAHMPSRPAPAPARRQLAAQGSVTPGGGTALRVIVDVMHPRGARSARGTFRVTDRSGTIVFEAREFGILQTLGTWASFTAYSRGSTPEGSRAATVVAEVADPLDPARAPSLRVIVEGRFEAVGRLATDAVRVR
jgi:N-acyl-D-aspartate/D-glutamate deacylase